MSRSTDVDINSEALKAFVARGVLLLVGFGEVVLLAHFLTPTNMGLYYFVLAGAQVAGQVLDGTSVAIRKRVSEVGGGTADYFGVGLVLTVGYGIFSLAVVGGLFSVVGKPVAGVSFPLAVGAVGVLTTFGFYMVTSNTLSGLGRPGDAFWLNTVRALLRIGLQIGVILLGGSVFELLVAVATANLLSGIATGILVDVPPCLPSGNAVCHLSTFAKYSIPNTLLQRLYARVDVLLLGALVGGQAVGFYEVALRLTMPAAAVAVAIGTPLSVKVSGLDSQGRDGLGDEFRGSLQYAGVLVIPVFFGSLVFSSRLLTALYPESYAAAWPALVGLALFQIPNSYRKVFRNLFDGLDRPEVNFQINLLTVVFFLPTAYFFVRRYALVGIIVATILAEVLRVVVYCVVSRRILDGEFFDLMPVKQTLAAVMMYGILASFDHALGSPSNTVFVVACLATGGLLYFGCLSVVSRGFRVQVRSTLRSVGGT